jgi:hypothetical protein
MSGLNGAGLAHQKQPLVKDDKISMLRKTGLNEAFLRQGSKPHLGARDRHRFGLGALWWEVEHSMPPMSLDSYVVIAHCCTDRVPETSEIRMFAL